MGLSLQNMRDAILKATGTDLTDWTNGNTDLDLFLNKSWWDIMEGFDFREKESEPTTFVTVAGTREYTMSTITSVFESIQRISIEDLNDFSHSDLELIQDFTYEDEYINTSAEQAKPTKYFRRAGKLFLYPTPDNVYTLTVYCLTTLADLAAGGPTIPQQWHEIIEMGGIWRALLYNQDLHKAAEYKRHQIDLINARTPVKAKELSDTKYAGVEVPGRDYP